MGGRGVVDEFIAEEAGLDAFVVARTCGCVGGIVVFVEIAVILLFEEKLETIYAPSAITIEITTIRM